MYQPPWLKSDEWCLRFWKQLDSKVGIDGLTISGFPQCRHYGPWVVRLTASNAIARHGVYARLTEAPSSGDAKTGVTYHSLYDLEDFDGIERAASQFSEAIGPEFAGARYPAVYKSLPITASAARRIIEFKIASRR